MAVGSARVEAARYRPGRLARFGEWVDRETILGPAFVTPALDSGPIIVQAAVPVQADDTEERLAARVLAQEHVVFPRAVRWFLDGRLVIERGLVNVKGGNAQLVIADRS